MCHLADFRDLNLLLVAAELGKNDVVKTLLNQNLEMEFKCSETGNIISAADLAWTNRHCDVIFTLLHANLRYPKGIVIGECSDELQKFISISEDLHMAIISRNEFKIQEILDESSNLNHFYDRLNISAPKLALDLKFIDIYELLLKNKIFLGYHETMSDLWTTFSDSERETLREIHFKYSINVPEKHLLALSANSSISHDDSQATQKLEYVRYAFGILNNNPLIRIILMIVAASKIFNIIFDFNRQSVNIVDPTADSWTRGLFYITGRIYIGAAELLRRSTENEAFGTLAHELCHYAMNLVYDNRAKPYFSNDKETRKKFSQISKHCKENSEKDAIIHHVYESYPKRMQHAELIVRIPHLLAMYHDEPDKLKELRENFGELFEFYENIVVPDMNKALPRIEIENQIEKKARKVFKYKVILVLVGIASLFGIISSVFIVRSIFYKPEYSFDNMSELDQKKVKIAPIIYKNVEIEFGNLFPENSTAYKKLSSDHISQILNGICLNFSDPYLHYLDELVVHDWKFMTEKLKNKILKSNFNFQNESLTFQILNEINPQLLNLLTSDQIVKILSNDELWVSKILSYNTKFYMKRRLFDENIFPIYFAYILNATEGDYYRLSYVHIVSKIQFKDFYKDFMKNQNESKFENEIKEIRQNSIFQSIRPTELKISENDTIISHKSVQVSDKMIIQNLNKIKLFILSSEAGTGKTTLFEHFAVNIKKEYPKLWVSYIDLKEHTALYNNEGELKNISNLISKILNLNLENEFEVNIFHNFFNSGQVVLLWNGFDEISPTYSEFIIKIIKSIEKLTNNNQLICTRPLCSFHLKNNFNASIYTLVPLDDQEQDEFVIKSLKSRKVHESKILVYLEKIKNVIKTLKSKSEQFLKTQDFDTPLVLDMFADQVSNDIEIFDSNNIYQIYKKFIEKKIQIWQKSDHGSKISRKIIISGFNTLEVYQKYALILLMKQFKYINQKIYRPRLKVMRQELPKLLTYEEISRMGILYINSDKEFEFSHKTFAEFFMAQYLIENIYNVDDVSVEEAEFRMELLYEITINYGYRQAIITDFLNAYLETEKTSEKKIFNRKISKVVTSLYKNIFFDFLNSENSIIFKFLFNFFKKDHNLLVSLLKVHEDETLYTATFNFVYFFNGGETLNRTYIKQLGYESLTKYEYELFLKGRNQKGIILFSQYCFNEFFFEPLVHDKYNLDNEMLSNEDPFDVFENIEKNLSKNELKQLLLYQKSPIYRNPKQLILNDNFSKKLNASLTKTDYKIYLINIFEKICAIKYYSREIRDRFPLSDFMNKIEEHFTSAEIQNIFFTNHYILASLRRSNFEESFEIFWNFFANHSSTSQQRKMLLQTENTICSQFSYLLYLEKCSPSLAQINILNMRIVVLDNFDFENDYVFQIYENLFNNSEIQQIFLSSNYILTFLLFRKSDINDIVNFLKYLFKGNEILLKDYLESKIDPTNLNIYEYMLEIGIEDDILSPLMKLLIDLRNVSIN